MNSELLKNLSFEEKENLFRVLWSEHVAEDFESFAEAIGMNLTNEQIKNAADRYVHGEYDCNQDYWTNLKAILETYENHFVDGSSNAC